MSNFATLPFWLIAFEEQHGGASQAAKHYNIDRSYWHRLKTGEKENPSNEILQRLGIQVAAVLYEMKS